jgi:hypothetical protein
MGQRGISRDDILLLARQKMLSPARKYRLTGSRISCLMTGDAAKILRLYHEMIGKAEEEDLSKVWAVQLGAATEPLNLDWYELRKNPLSRHGEFVVHPRYDWAGCTLDAWDDTLCCPVETKHVGGRESIETIVDRYQPQLQWQMECATANQCALSVIEGASPPIVEYIERDAAYAGEMVSRGRQFMDCVAARRPPVALPPAPVPVIVSKIYDFSGDNRWANAAVTWLMTGAAARQHIEAEKDLKEIVPEDAKKVTGYGVMITRDRARRLTLREMT